MAVLAILQADARVAARLSAALSGDHEVVVRPSWESLTRTLAEGDFDGCLVDADHPEPEEAARQIAALVDRHPALAILACVEATHGPGFYRLGGLGVAGVLPSRSPPAAVRSSVDRALATARADGVARALRGRIPAPGPAAIAWAVEHAGPDTSVDKLAAALGHTPRSLRDALDRIGMPAPTRVLLWGRLLLAGARLGSDRRTVEEVAFSLGYSTATSLARAMKQQTGLTPSEVSVRGGMERVRAALFSPENDDERTPRGLGKIASFVLLTLVSGCASLGGGPRVERGAIDRVLASPPTHRVHFGVLAIDARSGRTLYERNVDSWFVPASNQKILVTAAAWSLLGPQYRFRTDVWATGPTSGPVLEGDLVVVGSGDPSLSTRYWTSATTALEALVDSVRHAGVRRVHGRLVVDVAAWDSATVGPTREVEDLRFAYGSTGGAFAIEDGELEVVVHGAPPVGGLAKVEWSPVGTRSYVQSLVRTAPADSATRVSPYYRPESRQIVLEGQVAYGRMDTLRVAQRDPVRQATAALAEAATRAGLWFDRGWEIRWTSAEPVGRSCATSSVATCPGARLLTAIESPSLSELTATVLGPSQNWMAEQIVHALGAERGRIGSWSEGLRVIESFLVTDVGVDPLDIALRDGSGLSAYNLVTPRTIVRVLRYMAERPDADVYRAAMAEPGEVGSTLEDRLLDLQGRVFAKTGSISNVNSLSGYLVRESGDHVIFAILSNGSGLGASRIRAAIDEIVRALAR